MELQVSCGVCAKIQNVRYTEDPEIGKIKTESDFQPLGTKSLSGFTGDIDTLLSDIVARNGTYAVIFAKNKRSDETSYLGCSVTL